MSGGTGLGIYMLAVVGGVTFVGCCLLFSPVRTTRLLNDSFVIIPKVGGRHAGLKRVIAMTAGAALIFYGAYLVNSIFRLVHTLGH
jgi:hypothetical protein